MLWVPYKRSTFSFLLSKSSQPRRRRWTPNPTLRITTIGQVHTEHAGSPGKGHFTHPGGDEAVLSKERWVGAEWRRLDGQGEKRLEMRGRAYSAKHRIHREAEKHPQCERTRSILETRQRIHRVWRDKQDQTRSLENHGGRMFIKYKREPWRVLWGRVTRCHLHFGKITQPS